VAAALRGRSCRIARRHKIAPGVTRAAVLRDPAITSGIGQFGAIQAVAPSVGVEVSPMNVRDAGEIERAFATFAGSANGGVIVTASTVSGGVIAS
jgi:putative tryptophan/tyrosine transport system substrate-binding protein